MTDVDEKSRRLADWQELLGTAGEGGGLEAWRERLSQDAEAMRAQGLIDWEEAFELRELADAAYSHHLEDAIVRELNQYEPKP
ncbi:hypothetical protein FBY06_14036 [Pseudomonas sp. SJZ085]|uniref:hypothetical protein n=1 Tax=unclassified Pseudomonas TaxID=196821 RepID=UPI00119987C1|nr:MULTISPECIES: hypothetical protein [unclassified Pseudomonas]TWC12032.1 hypothetical protein FBX99_13936 [Pseudomonas sp. SJZ074]TWC30613.1 hypothetical protein FBY06_14036 [Pseudomonas sp. SJZ085]